MKISDLGIERNEASRCQRLANIPPKVFDEVFLEANKEELELSTATLLRLAKPYCRNGKAQKSKDRQKRSRSNVVLGVSSRTLSFIEHLKEIHDHTLLMDQILCPIYAGDDDQLHDVERKHLRRLVSETVRTLREIIACCDDVSVEENSTGRNY